MSDNKDISSSSTDNNKTSLLPENVQVELQRAMTEGFRDDYLNLRYK